MDGISSHLDGILAGYVDGISRSCGCDKQIMLMG